MTAGDVHVHQGITAVRRSGPCFTCGAVLCARCTQAIEHGEFFIEVRQRDLVDADAVAAIHLGCIAAASTITNTGLQPDLPYRASTAEQHLDAAGFTPAERVEFEATTAAYRAVMEWIDGDPSRGLIGCTPSMIAGLAINAYCKALAR